MDQLTFGVTPLGFYRSSDDGTELGRSIATGFFWRVKGQWFVITNWHNVTGLNPDSLTHVGNFTPTRVEVSLKYNRPEISGMKMVANQTHIYDLYKDESPIWLEHPERHKVDCVAIPIIIPDANAFAGKALNELDFTPTYLPAVGDDCFAIGYPHGLTAPGRTPIWKRASIASEPELDHDGLPIVLVDTATRKGMSGSPVIVRHSGVYMPNGTLTDDTIFGTVQNILGIYSGRIGDDGLGVQLGRVWKSRVINEVIDGRRIGLEPLNLAYPI